MSWSTGFVRALLVPLLLVAAPRLARAQEKPRELRLAGSIEADGIRLDEPRAEVRRTLRIESRSTSRVEGLRVSVDDFVDAQGGSHKVDWKLGDGDQAGRDRVLPVEAQRSVPLSISANLDALGTYKSRITLHYGSAPETIKLTIQRALTPASVEILAAEAARGDAAVFGTSKGQLSITLHETTGRKLDLYAPVLLSFEVRDGKGTERHQAPFILAASGVGEAGRLTLEPNETKRTTLTLSGLEGAGEYTGTVRVGEPGGQPVDRPISLHLRESGWSAFFWIALGVSLSLGLRAYGREHRPRLVSQRRAVELLEDLKEAPAAGGPLEEPEGDALTALRREITALLGDLDRDRGQDADAKLLVLERKRTLLDDWVRARRRVAALQPAALRASFADALRTSEALLVQRGGAIAAIDAQSGALVQMLTVEIPAKLRKELEDRLGLLDTEMTKERAAGSLGLVSRLQSEVAPLRDQAGAALGAGKLDEAMRAYAEARRTYVGVLLDELAGVVSGAALRDDLRGRLMAQIAAARADLAVESERAFGAYRAALAVYLGAVIDDLRAAIRARADEVAGDEDLGAADKESQTKELGRLGPIVDGALQRVGEGKLDEASKAFAEARAGFIALALAPRRTRGGGAVAAPQVASAAPLGSIPQALHGATGGAVPRPVPAATTLARRLTWADRAVAALAVVIACASGLLALWNDNPTWGGWGARIAALLWGLGLHQLAFNGISTLTDRLLGQKETT